MNRSRYMLLGAALAGAALLCVAADLRVAIRNALLETDLNGNQHSVTNLAGVYSAAYYDLSGNPAPTGGGGGGITLQQATNAAQGVVAASNGLWQAHSLNLDGWSGRAVFSTSGLASASQVVGATNGLGSAAFNPTSFFDLAGAAQNATNDYPWGPLYDASGAAQKATNALGSAAFQPSGAFDTAGTAQNATNGLKSGAFASAFNNAATNLFVTTKSGTSTNAFTIQPTIDTLNALEIEKLGGGVAVQFDPLGNLTLAGGITNIVGYGPDGTLALWAGTAGQLNVHNLSTTNSITANSFIGNGQSINSLSAANIAPGGTLPPLNGFSLTNLNFTVSTNGVAVGGASTNIDLYAGSNMSLTATNRNGHVDVVINSTGGNSSFSAASLIKTNYVLFDEDFIGRALPTQWQNSQVGAGNISLLTGLAYHPGIIQQDGGASSSDYEVLHHTTPLGPLGTMTSWFATFIFQTPSTNGTRFRIGFQDTANSLSVNLPTSFFGLRYDTTLGDTVWTAETRTSASVATATATSIQPDTANWHRLMIAAYVSNSIVFYLDNAAPVTNSANVPQGSCGFYIITGATGNTHPKLNLDYVSLYQLTGTRWP